MIADIPGLIEGASEGAGLGHQFLRHLSRTSLLLHVIDVAPLDTEEDPIAAARAIVEETEKVRSGLSRKAALGCSQQGWTWFRRKTESPL